MSGRGAKVCCCRWLLLLLLLPLLLLLRLLVLVLVLVLRMMLRLRGGDGCTCVMRAMAGRGAFPEARTWEYAQPTQHSQQQQLTPTASPT
jgi:hypothetical protein